MTLVLPTRSRAVAHDLKDLALLRAFKSAVFLGLVPMTHSVRNH